MNFFKTYTDAEVLIDCLKNNTCTKSDILKILDKDEAKYHLLRVHFNEELDYILEDGIVHNIIDSMKIDIKAHGYVIGSFTALPLRYENIKGCSERCISGTLYEVLGHYAILSDSEEFFGFFKKNTKTKPFFLHHCCETF